jgi:hypothetical protein
MVVRAVGSVGNRSTIIAPFTGRECALYRVELREWDDGTHDEFLTLVSEAPFYVSTANAKLLFDPAHSEVHIKGHPKKGDSLDNPSQLTALFDNHGLVVPQWQAGSRRSFRWRESILLSGDQIRIAGTLGSSPDSTGT